MSSLGDLWAEGDQDSASKKNIKQIAVGTGDYLQSLDKSKFKWAVCTEDSSDEELLQDHAYMVNAAEDSFIDVIEISSHVHRNSDTGGEFTQILAWNGDVCDLWLTKTQDLDNANWIKTVTGTGSIENKTDGTTGERSIRLRPNGTSGSGATISYPHLKLNFSKRSIFNTKLQIETATSIALHTGVGADDVTAADSNTRKYQAEVCTATNNNWWLRTANGSANSGSDSGIAITANRTAITLEHNPTEGTPTVDLYVETNAVFSKTTHVPTDGQTADNNLIKHSVKNSTAADRPLLVYGTRLSYTIKDDWFKQT